MDKNKKETADAQEDFLERYRVMNEKYFDYKQLNLIRYLIYHKFIYLS